MPTATSLTQTIVPPANMTSFNSSKSSSTSRGSGRSGMILRIPSSHSSNEVEECSNADASSSVTSRNCAESSDPQTTSFPRRDSGKDPTMGELRRRKLECYPHKTNKEGSPSHDDVSEAMEINHDKDSKDSDSLGEYPDESVSNRSQENKAESDSVAIEKAIPSGTENDIVSVLKRKDSNKGKSRDCSRRVSVSEPPEVPTMAEALTGDSRASGVSSSCSDTCETILASTPQPPVVMKRRISFPADSVLTAVIQDGDTAELARILTGRHGPGLVQRRGEGGVFRGVDVCQTNHVGLTALHHAVLANNLDAAKLLLCHGADVNAQDVHGFSPLHTAAACGFLHLTSLLLLFGADVFSLTLDNELPIDVTKELSVMRVLSGEMTRLVHQELWVTTVVRVHAEETWLLLRKLIACVLLFVLHVCICVRTAWRKHKKSE